MKCWSRSTLGVVMGSLNVLAYIICTVYVIISLLNINGNRKRTQYENDTLVIFNAIFAVLIAFCLFMILLSALLITGIVKRRHNLMLPWLIINGIFFILNCARFAYNIIAGLMAGIPLTSVLIVFIVGLVAIAFSVLLLWPIYTLYGDIRKEHMEKPGRVVQKPDNKCDYKSPPRYEI